MRDISITGSRVTPAHMGFTLVELSMVLVILALLVGGVLTGQALIRASELRSIIREYDQYMTAVNTFRNKYAALPGDTSNASKYWGLNTNCGGSDDNGTCSGNGNGQVTYNANNGVVQESFLFWQHLSLAGLIEGSYPNIVEDGTGATLKNSGRGKLAEAIWFTFYDNNATGSYRFDGYVGNALEYGKPRGAFGPDVPILKPVEMYSIDSKIDDGMPATGKLVVNDMYWPACTNAASHADFPAIYASTSDTVSCALIFRQLF